MKIIRQLNSLLSKERKWQLVLLIVMLLVGAVLETITVSLMLPFISGLLMPETLLNNIIFRKIFESFLNFSQASFLMATAFFISAMYLVKGIYIYLMNGRLYSFTASAQKEINASLFKHYLYENYSELTKTNTSSIINTVTNMTNYTMSMMNGLMQLAVESVTAIGLIGFVLLVDFRVTLLGGGLIVVIVVITNRVLTRKSYRAGVITKENGNLQIKAVHQAFYGIKEIKANKRETAFFNMYKDAMYEFVTSVKQHTIYAAMPRIIIEAGSMAVVFFGMGILISGVQNMVEILPVMASLGLAAYRLLPAANRIVTCSAQISNAQPSFNAVCDILNKAKRSPMKNKEEPEDATEEATPLLEGVLLENVSFKFQDTDEYLLRHITLKIHANKSSAFIGTTGSGKTTLADIILGIRNVEQGRISADGKDIYTHADWWANMVGYIPQQTYLCDDSICANVAFGIPREQIDEARVWKSLKDAQIDDFVRGLPNGIDMLVGENGIRLSGGQRQRIGIARALYRKPYFLVMDEGTSALDNETEQAIIEAINLLSGKITILIIAHRLSTIKYCDYVYKVEDGKVTLINDK